MIKEMRNIRILLAKPGFDGHWRGALLVGKALRDAGMEVIYLGNQSPRGIVDAAIQEDVDVVGLSILAAGHMRLIQEVTQMLPKDIMMVVGGTIPREDVPRLKEEGVSEVFLPGSRLDAIVNYIRKNAKRGYQQK